MFASSSRLIATRFLAPEQPAHVLAGAGDADGDIQVRGYRLAGEADLMRVVQPAGVASRAGRAKRAVQDAGKLLELVERIGPAQASAAADNDGGVFQPYALGLLLDCVQYLDLHVRGVDARAEALNVAGAARIGSQGLDGSRPHGEHLRIAGAEQDLRDGVSAVHRPGGAHTVAFHPCVGAVLRDRGVQPVRQARAEVTAGVRLANQNDVRAGVPAELVDRGHRRVQSRPGQVRVLDQKDFVGSVGNHAVRKSRSRLRRP